ncbi:hypothetical protein AALP_AAs47726U000400 [Arabis alpina]|uniref:Uncharacterized protein n=1 Tax=Arabis alpina TaxID=50452 RepID=A0A087FWV8_ARAAL|nr:hypothetical protein AALP_AAs47726U000400 [Arabis alpina]
MLCPRSCSPSHFSSEGLALRATLLAMPSSPKVENCCEATCRSPSFLALAIACRVLSSSVSSVSGTTLLARRADRPSVGAVNGFCCRGRLDDRTGVVKLSATGSIRATGFLNRPGSRGRARTSAPMDLSSSVIVPLALFCRSVLSSSASSVALIFCNSSGRSELALGGSVDFSPSRSARAAPAGGGSSRAAWSLLVLPLAWISPSTRSLGAASFGSAIRRSSVIVLWISSRWFFGVRCFQKPPPSSAKLWWWKPA